MASIIKTTAISLRKGDSEANRSFTGILGELVADLGADGTGTDINTTLRLHNGVLQGGIPMCRADFLNISTRQLAVGRNNLGMTGEKNLAYADLSNLETLTDSTAIQLVLNTLAGYGLAKKSYVDAELLKKANVDFSNIDTSDLASDGHGHAGKNLAYADTSNVNTADLTSSTIHTGTDGDKPLAYADASNLDTTNLEDRLAKIDLTNVTKLSLENALWNTQTQPDGNVDPERTQNKTNADLHTISDANKYPTVPAVKNYVEYEIENAGYLKRDYSNTETYDLLYSNFGAKDPQNNNYNVLYLADKSDYNYPSGIVQAGSGFTQNKLYIDTNNTILDASGTQSDTLKVRITEVSAEGIPTDAEFYQPKGKENIGSGTKQLKMGNSTVNITYTSTALGDGFYAYTLTNITPVSVAAGDFVQNSIVEVTPKVPLTQLLWLNVNTIDGSGAITRYSFYPTTGTMEINSGTYTFAPESGTSAKVKLKVSSVQQGGQLLKTDLSNLLGMTDEDRRAGEGNAWRINAEESIPTIQVQEAALPDNIETTMATQGQVWELAYDAYNKTMGQAAGREAGGALTDVATYVKRTLDQYALSDTYRGQVLYYLPDETSIPTTRPSGAALENGDQVLLKQKSDILGGRPYIGTWNGSTWTFTPFVNESSAQSNGDYVYCLDLGTWDTENYYNAPGNITWNARVTPGKLDIAPDHDNVPDGISIIKDPVTGQIKLGEYYVPAPEYFTGANTTTQTFTLQNNSTGSVPFDLYVSGVFQYPNTYSYNPTTRQITINFKAEQVQNNIVVIYRGIVFNGQYYTLTITTTPADATIMIDGMQRNKITVLAGRSVAWSVNKSGYTSKSGNELINDTHTLHVTLDA